VALNRSIILKYMYEIVMAAHRTYYHKVQDHSLPISKSCVIENLEALEIEKIIFLPTG
jgi:hypothetical protein